jgi:hypothetical protein
MTNKRFKAAVYKLLSNPALMKSLRQDIDSLIVEKGLDEVCFSMDNVEADTEPDGPVPTMEEYLKKMQERPSLS